jgi:hypothetical protein
MSYGIHLKAKLNSEFNATHSLGFRETVIYYNLDKLYLARVVYLAFSLWTGVQEKVYSNTQSLRDARTNLSSKTLFTQAFSEQC